MTIPKVPLRPSSVRSRVSNGKRSFVEGDGRGVWARRWRDLVELHVSDLGGPEGLSEAQLGMCRRIATIEAECERIEGKLSLGEEVDLDLYNRLSGNLRRLLDAIGIERRAKDVTPNLNDYLAKKGRLPATIEGETS